jgi:SAM-dependent methyltransferase
VNEASGNTASSSSAQSRQGPASIPAAAEPKYMLGHSPMEMRRLMTQADVLRPITERLLRAAGVNHGMRVLDVGCGVGDVSMLVAELVGPAGFVVGIDRNADAVAMANARVRSAGLKNVDFRVAALDGFTDETSFDCVVGRYVLIHQAHPADFLRAGARFLRRAGVIAVHEPDLVRSLNSSPVVPRWQAIGELIISAFTEFLPHYDAANRMVEHFTNAGLSRPSVFREIVVGAGEHSMFYRWAAETLCSLQPQLVEMGIYPKDSPAVEIVESKLRDAAVAAHSILEGPAQVGAWTRI